MKFCLSLFGLCALISLLSGCAVVPGNAQEAPSVYLLDTQFTPLKRRADGPSISVSLPQTSAGFDKAQIAYLRFPYRLEFYTQSHWADTPARMLMPLLVHALESSGSFSAVLAAPAAPLSGEYRLDSEIIRFQQEFFQHPSQVRLVLRVQLYHLAERRLIATRLFEIIEPAPTDNAQGGIKAMNLAVLHLTQRLREFVTEYVNDQEK